jgi:hypothetical protein
MYTKDLSEFKISYITSQFSSIQLPNIFYQRIDNLITHFFYIMLDFSWKKFMIVGFTTTYAISAYHHWCCEFKSRSGRGVQHYVMKFVSDLRQVGGFPRVLPFPPLIKPQRYSWNIFESGVKHHNPNPLNKTYLMIRIQRLMLILL